MRIRLPAAILLFVWSFLTTSSGGQTRPAARADAGGVLQRLTIANFGGSSVNSIGCGYFGTTPKYTENQQVKVI
jgi:hypothetical protein